MDEIAWDYNDACISDDEELLRRIPWKATFLVFDAQPGSWVPSAAAFRRAAGEGLSVHRRCVLERHGRKPEQIYDLDSYGSVGFLAQVPREVGGGVIYAPASPDLEENPDLRAAHAEVRPPTPEERKPEWSLIRNNIIAACRVISTPERSPDRSSPSSVRLPPSQPNGTLRDEGGAQPTRD